MEMIGQNTPYPEPCFPANFGSMNHRTIRPKTDLPQSTRIEGARLLQLCGGIPKVPSATRTVPLKRSPAGRHRGISGAP
jgi:hypothetical protein